MVIETDLAVGHHLLVTRQPPELIVPTVLDVFDFVGVDADRRVDEGVLVGEGDADRLVARSQPMVIIDSTPAARARAIMASRSDS